MLERGFPQVAIRQALGDPAPVLRLRLQQVPLRGLRRHHLLDRLPQGQLPDRVHGRAPHVGEGRQGQDGDLPQRVPPDEDPGPAARRQRVARQLHPGRQRHPLRPHRHPQRRQQRRRRHRRRARGEGPLRRLQRLHGQGPGAGLQQAGRRVADQGRRLRRHEAQAPGAGRPSTRRPSTSTSTSRRTRRSARTRSSAGSTTDDARLRRDRRDPRHRRLGQDDPARPRAGDARASTSPTTRCSASSTCSPRAPTARSAS